MELAGPVVATFGIIIIIILWIVQRLQDLSDLTNQAALWPVSNFGGGIIIQRRDRGPSPHAAAGLRTFIKGTDRSHTNAHGFPRGCQL